MSFRLFLPVALFVPIALVACAAAPVSPAAAPVSPAAADAGSASIDAAADAGPLRLAASTPWTAAPRVTVASVSMVPMRTRVAPWTMQDLAREPSGLRDGRPTVRGLVALEPHAMGGPAYRLYGVGDVTAYLLHPATQGAWVHEVTRVGVDHASYQVGTALLGAEPSWGLERKAHLVELELGGGHGDATNDGYAVVTNARVLDGTAFFPVDAADAFSAADALAKSAIDLENLRAQVTADAARSKVPAHLKPHPNPEAAGRLPTKTWLTWDDAQNAFVLTRYAYRSFEFWGPAPPEPKCEYPQPCIQQQRETKAIVVELAVEERVDARGNVTERVFGCQVRAAE